MNLEYGCARCIHRWTGYNTAHCGACHLTFTTVWGFDRHRRDGGCLNPADVGLVLSKRTYPCWAQPGRDTRFTAGVEQE